MKKWLWIALLVVLLIILSCKKEKREMEDMLYTAADNLAVGNVSEGVDLLIDAILLIRSHTEMPKNFEEKLLSAKNHFRNQEFSKGGELVLEALVLFKSGLERGSQSPGQKSAEVTETGAEQQVFPVAQMVRENIMQAVAEFKFGNEDRAVILILESLVLFGPPAE